MGMGMGMGLGPPPGEYGRQQQQQQQPSPWMTPSYQPNAMAGNGTTPYQFTSPLAGIPGRGGSGGGSISRERVYGSGGGGGIGGGAYNNPTLQALQRQQLAIIGQMQAEAEAMGGMQGMGGGGGYRGNEGGGPMTAIERLAFARAARGANFR